MTQRVATSRPARRTLFFLWFVGLALVAAVSCTPAPASPAPPAPTYTALAFKRTATAAAAAEATVLSVARTATAEAWATLPTPTAGSRTYPLKVRTRFVEGCVATSSGNVGACRCMLNWIEGNVPLEQFIQAEIQVLAGGGISDHMARWMSRAVVACRRWRVS